MILLAGETDLDGKIQRDLLGLVARTDLDGLIGGEAWIRGRNLTVASTAEIRGPATFVGPEQPVVASGAKLASPIRTEITQEIRRNRRSTAGLAIRAMLRYGWAFLIGLLLIYVFPGFFQAALREAGSVGLPIGVGALGLIVGAFVLVFGILLLVTGAGSVGVACALACAPILYVAQVFVGAWLGNKIRSDASTDKGKVLGRMALGLVILHATGYIPVVGGLVWLVVLLWGTGAVLLGFYRMSHVESAPNAPLPA
jgi:hypothetical protein